MPSLFTHCPNRQKPVLYTQQGHSHSKDVKSGEWGKKPEHLWHFASDYVLRMKSSDGGGPRSRATKEILVELGLSSLLVDLAADLGPGTYSLIMKPRGATGLELASWGPFLMKSLWQICQPLSWTHQLPPNS